MARRRAVLAGITVASLTGLLAMVGSPAASAFTPPKVAITSGPTVNADNSVSLGYSINRWPKYIRSRVCTVDTATTHTFVPCGPLTRPAANPTKIGVTLTGLADDTYTFTVRVKFVSGRRAAATSAPFTIDTGPAVDQENGLFGNTVTPARGCGGGLGLVDTDLAQTFTAGRTGSLTQVTLYAERGVGSGTLQVDIYATSGGYPTGGYLSTTTYPGAGSWAGFDLPLTLSVPLTQGTQYAIVMHVACDGSDLTEWDPMSGQDYAGGAALFHQAGFPWVSVGGAIPDFAFKTWMTN